MKNQNNSLRKRPSQYIDWVNLHRLESTIFASACINSYNGNNITVGRYLYKMMRRIDRIEARIAVEHEVKDRSYRDFLSKIIDRFDQ